MNRDDILTIALGILTALLGIIWFIWEFTR